MPCAMSITVIDGGDYQYFIGLQEKSRRHHLTGVGYKKTSYRNRITYYLTCRPVCSHRGEHATDLRLLMMQSIT